jgi:hypothetical protein
MKSMRCSIDTSVDFPQHVFSAFAREIRQRFGAVIALRAPGVFDSYRPELHYMRGPARNGVRSMASRSVKNTAVGDGAITRHRVPQPRARPRLNPASQHPVLFANPTPEKITPHFANPTPNYPSSCPNTLPVDLFMRCIWLQAKHVTGS